MGRPLPVKRLFIIVYVFLSTSRYWDILSRDWSSRKRQVCCVMLDSLGPMPPLTPPAILASVMYSTRQQTSISTDTLSQRSKMSNLESTKQKWWWKWRATWQPPGSAEEGSGLVIGVYLLILSLCWMCRLILKHFTNKLPKDLKKGKDCCDNCRRRYASSVLGSFKNNACLPFCTMHHEIGLHAFCDVEYVFCCDQWH